jgi:hypothetical protein
MSTLSRAGVLAEMTSSVAPTLQCAG